MEEAAHTVNRGRDLFGDSMDMSDNIWGEGSIFGEDSNRSVEMDNLTGVNRSVEMGDDNRNRMVMGDGSFYEEGTNVSADMSL